MSKGREQREGAEMKRHVSAEDVLDTVMQPLSASELQESSEEDTSIKGGLTQNAHWSASDPFSECGENTEDPVHPNSDWTAKNGQVWSPSHVETLRYIRATTGMMPWPTRYVISRICDVASSFDLFFTPDMIQLILQMTNLHRRHSVSGRSDGRDLGIHVFRLPGC